MRERHRLVAGAAGLASFLLALAGSPLRPSRDPTPEKYPGQRSRWRGFCWRGDGVPSRVGTKRERDARREGRRRCHKCRAVCRPGSHQIISEPPNPDYAECDKCSLNPGRVGAKR